MTASRIWLWVRWPVAILGLLLVVRYAYPRAQDALGGMVSFDAGAGSIFGGGSTPTPTETATGTVTAPPTIETATLPPQTGAVIDGTAVPTADFHTTEFIVGDITEPELVIGDADGDAVVIGFPLIAGDPTCVAEALFSFSVIDSASPTQVGVFASSVTTPQSVVVSERLDAVTTPGAIQTTDLLLGDDGRVELDVTDLYADYVTAGGLPADADFAIAIRPTAPVEIGGGVTLASSEATDSDLVPTLTWTGDAACGSA